MAEVIYRQDFYLINGILMTVFHELGKGLNEIVYKDAIQYEFSEAGIHFCREKEFKVQYKNIVLPHSFFADFVVMDKIILEVKAQSDNPDLFIAQTLNYLKISGYKLGIIANYGVEDFKAQRVVLT